MPHWPYGLNSRGLASTAAFGLMKASCRFLVIDSRQRLAVPLLQLGLGIEEIDLARAALHEHEDDVLRLGGEVRLLAARADSCRRPVAPRPSRASRLRQRDGADAARAIAEELAPRLDIREIVRASMVTPS